MSRLKLLGATASVLLLGGAAPLLAQDLAAVPPPVSQADDLPVPTNDEEIVFSAGTLEYDSRGEVLTASGGVRMLRAGNRLRADRVIWNQATGRVRAEGDVAVLSPGGDTAYGDVVELTETLRDGVIDNLLLVLADGGRLAAVRGTRVDGVTTLERAAYTPCPVESRSCAPKGPSWKITAVRVIHDPVRNRISYKDARLALFGQTVLWLPALSHPDGGSGGGPGLLMANVRVTRTNGAELAVPYYLTFGSNRDLTITPHVYSRVLPALEAQYRALSSLGAYQVGGMITYGSRLPATLDTSRSGDRDRGLRGHLDASGRFQFTPEWSLTGSARYASDRTFLRRYDISNDDRLRSSLVAERITQDSYLSIAGWAVQSLRLTDTAGQQPVALPAIDFRQRLADPLLGGRVELQLNSLGILRTEGQDTQRAFAGARWDLRGITRLGQEVVLTAYARTDVYHSDNVLATPTVSYRGVEGWSGRGIAALAAELRWPFAGAFLGGTQRITPRFQVVASPDTRNLDIPNEDARAVELEDSNLFALNRFPGYDRWEDGTRFTYGGEYALDLPRFTLRSVVGQSYRLTEKPGIFPDGTGFTDRLSDVVGRTTVRFGRYWGITHRYRLDKDSYGIRRNEIDATLGGRSTYASIGYLRLNRDVALEDLRDREEIRLGGRIQFRRYWSLFGSTVIDLSDASEDPLSNADGYEPVRHRLGILYNDECLELGVTWRRDYEVIGDARRGNTFLLRLALKNIGG